MELETRIRENPCGGWNGYQIAPQNPLFQLWGYEMPFIVPGQCVISAWSMGTVDGIIHDRGCHVACHGKDESRKTDHRTLFDIKTFIDRSPRDPSRSYRSESSDGGRMLPEETRSVGRKRMTVDRAFEYRIYPNAHQRELIGKTFGCCRYVYNKVLALRQEEYRKNGCIRSIYAYMRLLPEWKRSTEPWLVEVDSIALQQSLRDLDKAYGNFFRNPRKVGFPKFKSKRSSRRSYRTTSVVIIDRRHVRLPKLGVVKARISRPVEGRILSATIKQMPSGRYFVTICCADAPIHVMPKGDVDVLGIDAGIHNIAVCSNGERLHNPRYLARNKRKLAREQRRLSRKRKGSHNREKQRVKVARIHEKVANQRKDTLHRFTTHAVCESQAIAVEDLNVRVMFSQHHIARNACDSGMGEMIRQLEYKCAWYGRDFVKVDRFYPSSETCGRCGYVFDDLKLGRRSWTCPKCFAHHDRDLNAATNIAREGRRLLGAAGHAETAA